MGLPSVLKSRSFKTPPTDGSLLIHQLVEWNAKNSPDHPVYVYDTPEGTTTAITWREAHRALQRAAHFVLSALRTFDIRGDPTSPPHVAIISNSHNVTYHLFMMGLIRCGYQPLPISTKNIYASTIARVITQTPTIHLFASGDETAQLLAKDTIKEMAKLGRRVSLLVMPEFSELFLNNSVDIISEPLPSMGAPSLDSPATTLLSSGSTSDPKLRVWTHRIVLEWARSPYFDGGAPCVTSIHSFQVCHALGLGSFLRAAGGGMVMSCLNPTRPIESLTTKRHLESCKATETTSLWTLPRVLEQWCQDPFIIEYLKTLKVLYSAGSLLGKEVGDCLASKGVPIRTSYGSTEVGCITGTTDYGWEYMTFLPNASPVMIPQDAEGIFELAFIPNALHTPAVTNRTHEGKEVYATSDLFTKHPTAEGVYKILGRADDQIISPSCEKTNPVPLEQIIGRSPLVNSTLLFGSGRSQNGVLIEPVTPVDPENAEKQREFKDAVWPYVEEANASVVPHSRIVKEMVIVCKPGKPFLYTAKQVPRRHVSVALYGEEIDAAYKAVEGNSDCNGSQ